MSGEKHKVVVRWNRSVMRPAAILSYLLLCMALFFLSSCSVPGGSEAACGQGLPVAKPSRAAPGEVFRLSGRGFGGGCDDSNLPFRPDPPQQDMLIQLRQGGKAWDLATVDAGGPPRYAINVKLEVPKGAKPGSATVVVHRADPLGPMRVPFRVLGDVPGCRIASDQQ